MRTSANGSGRTPKDDTREQRDAFGTRSGAQRREAKVSDAVEFVPHPAKYSDVVLDKIAELCDPTWLCLDPFTGTGRCHELVERGAVADMIGIELEPEWAHQHPATIRANVLDVDQIFMPESFDAVITSPCYGNRMADHHNAKDGSRRVGYKFSLGRDLHPANAGQLQWGDKYRTFHEEAWAKVVPLIKPGGVFILNIEDHIRRGEIQPVTAWHVEALCGLGLIVDASDMHLVGTPGMRFGANHEKRVVEGEWVIALEKPC